MACPGCASLWEADPPATLAPVDVEGDLDTLAHWLPTIVGRVVTHGGTGGGSPRRGERPDALDAHHRSLRRALGALTRLDALERAGQHRHGRVLWCAYVLCGPVLVRTLKGGLADPQCQIRVALLVSVVVTPGRFRTRSQFWSYWGLGIVMRSSSDWVRDGRGEWARTKVQQTRGLNFNHNHTLKNVFNETLGEGVFSQRSLSERPLRGDRTLRARRGLSCVRTPTFFARCFPWTTRGRRDH